MVDTFILDRMNLINLNIMDFDLADWMKLAHKNRAKEDN